MVDCRFGFVIEVSCRKRERLFAATSIVDSSPEERRTASDELLTGREIASGGSPFGSDLLGSIAELLTVRKMISGEMRYESVSGSSARIAPVVFAGLLAAREIISGEHFRGFDVVASSHGMR